MSYSLTDRLFRAVAGFMERRFEERQAAKGLRVPGDVRAVFDVPYKSRDGAELFMDVYRPAVESCEKLPLIIDVHGGGLFMGKRKLSVGIGAMFAQKGYIFCALEYRHVPDVRAFEEMADVCAGMDFTAEYLKDADLARAYLFAESAGAFLGVYAASTAFSGALSHAVGCAPPRLRFRAAGFIGGMFYTRGFHRTAVLSGSIYGRDARAKAFRPYADPEHPDVITHLPPALLMTSRKDILRAFSYEYKEALDRHGIENDLIDMGDDRRLTHAFPVLHPEYPESAEAVDHFDRWFGNH